MADATVRDRYERHLRRRGLARGTVAHYRAAVDVLEMWMRQQDLGLLDATTEDIEAMLDKRVARHGGPIAKRTRYFWLTALHAFWVWANRDGHAVTDPTDPIIRPKLPHLLPRPIANDHLALALDAAQNEPMLLAWFVLAAYGGLRCSEIGKLNADDVDFSAGLLHVHGKNDKERMVPIHPLVERTLRYHGIPAGGPIFLRVRGGRYPAWAVSHDGNDFLRDLGLSERMHTLRHWFGTNALRECHDLRIVQELMGHADPATTAIYTAFDQVEGRAAIAALPLLTA